MEFSPEPDDEDLSAADYTKRRLEPIESFGETNSLEDTNSLGHRDSINQTDPLLPRDPSSSSFMGSSFQDSTIDTGSSNSDGDAYDNN